MYLSHHICACQQLHFPSYSVIISQVLLQFSIKADTQRQPHTMGEILRGKVHGLACDPKTDVSQTVKPTALLGSKAQGRKVSLVGEVSDLAF